jgi:hypothetical protein
MIKAYRQIARSEPPGKTAKQARIVSLTGF